MLLQVNDLQTELAHEYAIRQSRYLGTLRFLRPETLRPYLSIGLP
jgi:hypothetical protein